MTKQKTVPELKAEIAANERQLAQLRHKQQQLENRAVYYEKGDRRKRAHRLITRGAAVESVVPLAKVLSETEFYAFAGVVTDLAVVFAVQLFPGTVGGSSHGRLPRAALDLRHMKMKECDIQSPPAWRLTASARSLCASGRAKTCSAKA